MIPNVTSYLYHRVYIFIFLASNDGSYAFFTAKYMDIDFQK